MCAVEGRKNDRGLLSSTTTSSSSIGFIQKKVEVEIVETDRIAVQYPDPLVVILLIPLLLLKALELGTLLGPLESISTSTFVGRTDVPSARVWAMGGNISSSGGIANCCSSYNRSENEAHWLDSILRFDLILDGRLVILYYEYA